MSSTESGHTVKTHVRSIIGKLGLTTSDEDHRRVLAVLVHLSGPG